jgi:outer membrane protein assembly factor BamB
MRYFTAVGLFLLLSLTGIATGQVGIRWMSEPIEVEAMDSGQTGDVLRLSDQGFLMSSGGHTTRVKPDGTIAWTLPVAFIDAIQLSTGQVVLLSYEGTVTARDLAIGGEIWRTAVGTTPGEFLRLGLEGPESIAVFRAGSRTRLRTFDGGVIGTDAVNTGPDFRQPNSAFFLRLPDGGYVSGGVFGGAAGAYRISPIPGKGWATSQPGRIIRASSDAVLVSDFREGVNQDRGRLSYVEFDTGKVLWTISATQPNTEYLCGAQIGPHVFVVLQTRSASGAPAKARLECRRVADGTRVWATALTREHEARNPMHLLALPSGDLALIGTSRAGLNVWNRNNGSLRLSRRSALNGALLNISESVNRNHLELPDHAWPVGESDPSGVLLVGPYLHPNVWAFSWWRYNATSSDKPEAQYPNARQRVRGNAIAVRPLRGGGILAASATGIGYILTRFGIGGQQVWESEVRFRTIGGKYQVHLQDADEAPNGDIIATVELHRIDNITIFPADLVRIDGRTGRICWTRRLHKRDFGWSRLSVTSQGVVVVFQSYGESFVPLPGVRAFDARSGRLLWQSDKTFGAVLPDGRVLLNDESTVLILNGVSGDIQDRRAGLGPILPSNGMEGGSTTISLSSAPIELRRFDVDTGAILWSIPYDWALMATSDIRITENSIWFVSLYPDRRSLRLGRVDRETGVLGPVRTISSELPPGAAVTNVILGSNSVYVVYTMDSPSLPGELIAKFRQSDLTREWDATFSDTTALVPIIDLTTTTDGRLIAITNRTLLQGGNAVDWEGARVLEIGPTASSIPVPTRSQDPFGVPFRRSQ